MTPLEAALDYARRGWRVIRVARGGKGPVDHDWANVASTDPEVIRRWFADDTFSVGIVCDEAFGWVLDIDDPKVLNFFEARGWLLPRTVTARTPSGGLHFAFKHPAERVRCRSDGALLRRLVALGYEPTPGMHTIDTRGVPGGQIVVAPTVRSGGPHDGKAYEWLDLEAQVAEAPAWLLDLVKPAGDETLQSDDAVDAMIAKSPTRELSADELGKLQRLVSPIFELTEGRYTAIHDAAIECGRMMLPFEMVFSALDAAADANGFKERDARGTRRQIMRGWAFGFGQAEAAAKNAQQVASLREKLGFTPRSERAPFQNERFSHPAAARRVLHELGGPDAVVYDEGAFWHYQPERGIWVEIDDGTRYRAIEAALVDHVFLNREKPLELTTSVMKQIDEMLAIECTKHSAGFFAAEKPMVAVANGVLCPEGGRIVLRPHDPDLRLRFGLPVEWDPEATAPKFAAVLESSLDNARLVDTIDEWWGATIFGRATKYQRVLAFVGKGANGKSLVLNAYASLVERVCSVPPNKLRDDRQVATLAGKRLNLCSEIPDSHLRGESLSLFKAAAVGDTMQGRDVYKAAVTFRPICGMALSCNRLPRIVDVNDEAIFRRFIVIMFTRVLSEEEQNPDLLDEIIAEERAGILARVVRGYERLIARGRFAADATGVELWRRAQDPLRDFLRDKLLPAAIKEREGRVAVDRIGSLYGEWIVGFRLPLAEIKTQKDLTHDLRERGWVDCKTYDAKRARALAAPRDPKAMLEEIEQDWPTLADAGTSENEARS